MELQKIIEELEGNVQKDKATFGIFQYGGGGDESFIRADKEGLKLSALELLNAADKSADILEDVEKSIILIVFEEAWISEESDTVVQYVEPISERVLIEQRTERKESSLDKLVPIGCLAVVIILFIAVLIGLWTIAKWLF